MINLKSDGLTLETSRGHTSSYQFFGKDIFRKNYKNWNHKFEFVISVVVGSWPLFMIWHTLNAGPRRSALVIDRHTFENTVLDQRHLNCFWNWWLTKRNWTFMLIKFYLLIISYTIYFIATYIYYSIYLIFIYLFN